MKKECEHKKLLAIYGREQGSKTTWISSKNITGYTLYICSKCGKIFRDKIVEVED